MATVNIYTLPLVWNRQTGTSYTLQASDNTKVVKLTNASPITVTVPNNMADGWSCMLVQGGAGQVTLAPAAGATISHRLSHTRLAGQSAVASLVSDNAANGTSAAYVFSGDTA